MSIPDFWLDPEWQARVIKTHQDMMDENALYEELADDNELKTDEEIGELFAYHRRSVSPEASAGAFDKHAGEDETLKRERDDSAQDRESDNLP